MLFPDICQMAENHMAKVMECMELSSERIIWCPTLRRAAFDWELPSLFCLMDRLSNVDQAFQCGSARPENLESRFRWQVLCEILL